ncbi:MAG: hypothetical protein JNK05_13815 [Myxococcales bacterium]|nr:hypothetical protein [Myxococcales bacterium]
MIVASLDVNVALVERAAIALGRTAIEGRQWAKVVVPRIAARIDDPIRARAFATELAASGLDVECIEDSEVVSSSEMLEPRTIAIASSGLVTDLRPGQPLEYRAITALVRARVSGTVVSTTIEVERVPSGKGGTVAVPVERTTHERNAEEVLYVFSSTDVPWLLVQSLVRYGSLGIPLRFTQRENFDLIVETLRANAPWAGFDETLRTASVERAATVAKSETASRTGAPPRSIDLAAHVLARCSMRKRSVYR